MKKITLDNIIKEHQIKDKEFAAHYQKEVLINGISKIIINLRKKFI
jgi:hypothetical protein